MAPRTNSCIVILSNVPWDWSTDYVNQTAWELSKRHKVICFYWLQARSLKEQLMSPQSALFKTLHRGVVGYYGVHFLPFRRFSVVQKINLWINVCIVKCYVKYVFHIQSLQQVILWFFDPRVWEITRMFGHTPPTVYDCIDAWGDDIGLTKKSRSALQHLEYEVIVHATTVVVNSHALYDRHRFVRDDIRIVPQGFRVDMFQHPHRFPFPLLDNKPLIGYVGAINARLDYQLLLRVARLLPHARFLFVGPWIDDAMKVSQQRAKRTLFLLKNVTHLGSVQKVYVPDIVRRLAIGIIPYRVDEPFNRYSFPMKTLEYFYEGKPIIATPIEELKRYPMFIHLANTPHEWVVYIHKILSRPWPAHNKKEQRKLAMEQRWTRKIEMIEQLIDKKRFSYPQMQ